MGTAAMGIENCTCRNQLTTEYQFESERVRKVLDQLKEVEQENARLNRIIRNIYKKRNEKYFSKEKATRKRN